MSKSVRQPTFRAARGLLAPGLLLASTLAACGGSGGASVDDWAGTVSDSAGVLVVSNPDAGLWGSTPAWTMTEEYRVGGMDASTDAQLGQVVGLDIDAQGNVYVADQQASRILVYSADGDYVHTIGNPGQGPGEIGQALAGVFVVGDQVWAADIMNQRVNQYGLDGEAMGSTPLDLTQGMPVRWDEIDGDRVIAQLRSLGAMGGGEDTDEGDPLVFFGEETSDTLAVLPKGLSFQISGGQMQFRFFEAEPVWDASADGRLTSAVNSGYRIEIRGADGTLERVVTRPFEPRPVEESDQQVMLDGIRQLMNDQGVPPEAAQMVLGQAEFADFYPAFAQVLAGPNGTLWVQRLTTPQDMADSGTFDLQDFGSDDWDVFDPEGRYLGVMTMPERFTPLRVTDDAFWGVQRDEFDVQSVVRFRLTEAPS